MHRADTALPVALVSVTSPLDGREHLVDEVTFATSREGRWTAVCGAMVVSASLGADPGRPCAPCADRRESHHLRQPEMTSWWAATIAAVPGLVQRLLDEHTHRRQGPAAARSDGGRHRVAR